MVLYNMVSFWLVLFKNIKRNIGGGWGGGMVMIEEGVGGCGLCVRGVEEGV